MMYICTFEEHRTEVAHSRPFIFWIHVLYLYFLQFMYICRARQKEYSFIRPTINLPWDVKSKQTVKKNPRHYSTEIVYK